MLRRSRCALFFLSTALREVRGWKGAREKCAPDSPTVWRMIALLTGFSRTCLLSREAKFPGGNGKEQCFPPVDVTTSGIENHNRLAPDLLTIMTRHTIDNPRLAYRTVLLINTVLQKNQPLFMLNRAPVVPLPHLHGKTSNSNIILIVCCNYKPNALGNHCQ